MGGFFSKLGSLKLFGRDWSLEPMDSAMEQQQKEYEMAVLDATDAGDVEVLQDLHEQECLLFWGGIDSIAAKPPLLHRATAKGHQAVVDYLMTLGADVDETDSSGMTVLHTACKTLENSCLPTLLDRCRDIDKRDVWGRTPLIKALVYRNVEAAQMLLERGANPNATDIYGMTPLTTAIDYNMMDVLSLLVRHGADIDLITHHHGRCSGPPLYLAINNQNLPVVQELLRLGAATQPRIQDYNTNLSAPWNYINLGSYTPPITPTLQYNDAVSLCMYEVVRRGEPNISQCSVEVHILMQVLAAHGHPLGPSPDILIRVLLNSRSHDFSMLLYKLQICCSSCSEDIIRRLAITQSHRGGGGISNGRVQKLLKQPPRLVSSLQNQARRAARKGLMASNHNVTWACQRLQCPPALKTLLLLKEVDRAFEKHKSGLQVRFPKNRVESS